ncbi:DUF3987 domain-containing protein [Flavobacteriaceae bacterium]|jgi:hypothetical protein|nr:DUF3987 domain-containing protein [Flavobacteriaceae bacterium]|tara:strand:+ start:20196 stop:22481 length:2286 start_codon:yes stop_codon:yes gene_type:complete
MENNHINTSKMASSTIYKNFNQPIENKALLLIVKDVIEGKYKEPIEAIRMAIGMGKPERADQFKKELVAFTPSATFEGGRKMEYFKMYSGFVHLDFDKLEPDELQEAKQKIQSIPYTFACFTSPSGNGLKVFIEINTGAEHHKTAYAQVQAYYEKEVGIEADPKCKDITRLCFVSYDPNGYKNIQNEKFKVKTETVLQPLTASTPKTVVTQNPIPNEDTNNSETFTECITFTENKESYADGNRNNFIYQLACNCNRRGIVYDDALHLILNTYDLNQEEIKASVKSAYDNNAIQFASYPSHNQTAQPNEIVSDEDYLKNTPTFDEQLFDNLPEVLRKGTMAFTDPRERDVFFTGALSILSGCLPNVSGVYAQQTVFPNLFSFIIAPAASGKGALKFAKVLADPYQESILEQSNQDKSIYDAELAQYKAEQRNRKKDDTETAEEPVKPPFKVVFIPANTSSAAILSHIKQNEGKGIICETEADSMGAVFKQDWGGYSDMLRKAFHHETISISRKTDNEYIIIKDTKLSVALSGTPGQVSNIISSAEDGLFSRFIFYTFKVEQVWKDVSPFGNTLNLNDHFEVLSQNVLEMINFLETNHTQIHLTQEQWQTVNYTGQQWLTEVTTFTAEEAGSVVKRLGLVLYRITMIFTALRKFDNGDCAEDVTCTDEDFEMALMIANVYLQHGLLMYNNLPKKEEAGVFKGANNKKQFFEALPQNFKREEAILIGKKYQLKDRSIDALLKSLVGSHLSQPSYGHYQKTTDKL